MGGFNPILPLSQAVNRPRFPADSDDGPRREQFASIQEFIRAFEEFHDARTPTSGQVLDRAARFASNSLGSIDLQIRRIRATEPEDEEWPFRVLADFQFLVQALWQMRQAGYLALQVDPSLTNAVGDFNVACPDLATMRHVAQHWDQYAIDQSRRQRRPDDGKPVGRRSLENHSWDNDTFRWLGGTVELTRSRDAAALLYRAITNAGVADSRFNERSDA